MMLGVRVAVGRQCNPLDQPGEEIGEEAFSQVNRVTVKSCDRTIDRGILYIMYLLLKVCNCIF